MTVDLPVFGDTIPGGGPSDRMGLVIPVHLGTVAADGVVLGGDCILMGWSVREPTGLGGATAELFSGGSTGGELLGIMDLNLAFDPSASQTPADAQASGAAAALAPSIGGAAGTTVFIQSLRITGLGATAGSEVTATLTGVLGGTINYPISVPAGVATPIAPVLDSWPGRGLEASGVAQAITLNVPSFGAGNTLAEAAIQGYVQTAAGVSDTRWFGPQGIYARGGIFLHLVSGTVRGTLWIRQ